MPPALLRYLVVSYALAALLGGGAGLIGQGPGTLGFVALAALMMWTPTVGAWAAQRAKGEALVEPLGLRPVLNRWLLIAVLAPLGLALLTTAFQLMMPGVSFNPDPASILSRVSGVMTPDQLAEATATLNQLPIHPYWLSLLQAVGAGLTVNALFAFGEEVGWRGFMFKALDGRGFWSVSLLTGVAWGFWHAPVILQGYNYPQHPLLGVPLFAVFCVLLSPLHTLVRERGGRAQGATERRLGLFAGLVQQVPCEPVGEQVEQLGVKLLRLGFGRGDELQVQVGLHGRPPGVRLFPKARRVPCQSE